MSGPCGNGTSHKMSGTQDAENRAIVEAFLRSQNTMTLSTCDESGWPQATPLFYIVDEDMRLYWVSSLSSAHSHQLAREPRAAVSIYRPTDDWKKICGVQMRGDVTRVVPKQKRKTITDVYCSRFNLGIFFRPIISRSALFYFIPSWIRYIDNERQFGYKFELILSGT